MCNVVKKNTKILKYIKVLYKNIIKSAYNYKIRHRIKDNPLFS